MMAILKFMYDEANINDKYGVNEFISSMGLLVVPEYRGLGLGQRLLETR